MTRYHTSQHAICRAQERCREMAPLLTTHCEWACWVARLAQQGRPIGSQFGPDLMLRVETHGRILYLPISPGHGRDTWTIRTVLNEEQALANLAEQRERIRASWRRRKRYGRQAATRSYRKPGKTMATCGRGTV